MLLFQLLAVDTLHVPCYQIVLRSGVTLLLQQPDSLEISLSLAVKGVMVTVAVDLFNRPALLLYFRLVEIDRVFLYCCCTCQPPNSQSSHGFPPGSASPLAPLSSDIYTRDNYQRTDLSTAAST